MSTINFQGIIDDFANLKNRNKLCFNNLVGTLADAAHKTQLLELAQSEPYRRSGRKK